MRARICVDYFNRIESIHVGGGGQLQHTGHILTKYYTNIEKIQELLTCGSIRELRETFESSYSRRYGEGVEKDIFKKNDDYCLEDLFYRLNDIKHPIHVLHHDDDWIYLWKNNQWWVVNGTTDYMLKTVDLAFKEEEKRRIERDRRAREEHERNMRQEEENQLAREERRRARRVAGEGTVVIEETIDDEAIDDGGEVDVENDIDVEDDGGWGEQLPDEAPEPQPRVFRHQDTTGAWHHTVQIGDETVEVATHDEVRTWFTPAGTPREEIPNRQEAIQEVRQNLEEIAEWDATGRIYNVNITPPTVQYPTNADAPVADGVFIQRNTRNTTRREYLNDPPNIVGRNTERGTHIDWQRMTLADPVEIRQRPATHEVNRTDDFNDDW